MLAMSFSLLEWKAEAEGVQLAGGNSQNKCNIWQCISWQTEKWRRCTCVGVISRGTEKI